jgi:hypothetical protein
MRKGIETYLEQYVEGRPARRIMRCATRRRRSVKLALGREVYDALNKARTGK